MKKTLILAAAAIAALSACTKEIEVAPSNDSKAPVFTATIESETKTQLVEGTTAGKLTKVEWLSSDQVFIVTAAEDGSQGVVGTYNVTPGSPATTATLKPGTLKVNNSITTKTTVALYPASYSYVAALDAESITSLGTQLIDQTSFFVLPLTQQYNGADISQIAPMVAVETTGSTQLEFKNLTALLAITVSSEDFASVSSIKVSSDKVMNGYFMYYPKTGIFDSLPMASMYTDANKVTTLDCQNAGANTTIPAESKTFYVSIPDNTYEYLQIEVTDGTNTKTMKTKAANITVERNKIYPIAFADNQTPAHAYVDLGLSVKWATMNVGATTPEGYGDYFAWGATEPLYEAGYAQESPQDHWKTGKSAGYCMYNTPYQTVNTTNNTSAKWTKYLGSTSSSYKDSSASNDDLLKTVLDAGDDAARANWGGSWRMPTREEWAELINSSNCKWTWTTQEGIKGYKVQSKKTGYTDNWIFLPAAGWRTSTNLEYLGTWCYYWSSSLLTSNPYAAGALKGNEDVYQATNYNRNLGISIRPVCK